MNNGLDRHHAVRLATGIHGWCEEGELEWLYDKATELKPGETHVHLGVWKGRSLCPVLFGMPFGAKVWAVDHFRGHHLSLTHYEARFTGWVPKHVQLLIDLARHERSSYLHVTLLERSSEEALDYVVQESSNWTFLDSDYRDDYTIRKDISMWGNQLAPGGLLCGRNYGLQAHVTHAVDDLLLNRATGPGTIWYWRKP